MNAERKAEILALVADERSSFAALVSWMRPALRDLLTALDEADKDRDALKAKLAEVEADRDKWHALAVEGNNHLQEAGGCIELLNAAWLRAEEERDTARRERDEARAEAIAQRDAYIGPFIEANVVAWLRSDPDRAVRVMAACKVAGPWSRNFGGGRRRQGWDNRPCGCAVGVEAEMYFDEKLLADGWVLASGAEKEGGK